MRMFAVPRAMVRRRRHALVLSGNARAKRTGIAARCGLRAACRGNRQEAAPGGTTRSARMRATPWPGIEAIR